MVNLKKNDLSKNTAPTGSKNNKRTLKLARLFTVSFLVFYVVFSSLINLPFGYFNTEKVSADSTGTLQNVTKDNFLQFFTPNNGASTGTATGTYNSSTGTLTFTTAANSQIGNATLTSYKLDMTQAWSLSGSLTAGKTGGADGVGFGLYNGNVGAVGKPGLDLGIGGMQGAFGWAVDSYNNGTSSSASDPDYTYTGSNPGNPGDPQFSGSYAAAGWSYAAAYQKPGDALYAKTAYNASNSPQLNVTGLLNNNFHSFSLSYVPGPANNPTNGTLKASWGDGSSGSTKTQTWSIPVLTLEILAGDAVTDASGNTVGASSLSFFMSGSTGGYNNLQQFRPSTISFTAASTNLVKHFLDNTGNPLVSGDGQQIGETTSAPVAVNVPLQTTPPANVAPIYTLQGIYQAGGNQSVTIPGTTIKGQALSTGSNTTSVTVTPGADDMNIYYIYGPATLYAKLSFYDTVTQKFIGEPINEAASIGSLGTFALPTGYTLAGGTGDGTGQGLSAYSTLSTLLLPPDAPAAGTGQFYYNFINSTTPAAAQALTVYLAHGSTQSLTSYTQTVNYQLAPNSTGSLPSPNPYSETVTYYKVLDTASNTVTATYAYKSLGSTAAKAPASDSDGNVLAPGQLNSDNTLANFDEWTQIPVGTTVNYDALSYPTVAGDTPSSPDGDARGIPALSANQNLSHTVTYTTPAKYIISSQKAVTETVNYTDNASGSAGGTFTASIGAGNLQKTQTYTILAVQSLNGDGSAIGTLYYYASGNVATAPTLTNGVPPTASWTLCSENAPAFAPVTYPTVPSYAIKSVTDQHGSAYGLTQLAAIPINPANPQNLTITVLYESNAAFSLPFTGGTGQLPVLLGAGLLLFVGLSVFFIGRWRERKL